MNKETVTLTKALTVVKNLSKQIEDQTPSSNDFIYLVIGEAKKGLDGRSFDEINKSIISFKDQQDNLYNRLLAFKKAVRKANAEVCVTVNGVPMTINDAIVERGMLASKRTMLTALKSSYASVLRVKAEREERLSATIEKSISAFNIGATGTNTTWEAETRKVMADAQKKEFEPYLVDPTDVPKRIVALEKQILELDTELDERLSVINATTTIVVEY